MALKFNHPLILLLLQILAVVCICSAISSAAFGGRKKVGGWKVIDPKDPKVVEYGKFAIDEHNKDAKTNLQFKTVVKAQRQVVNGFNYKLDIQAMDDNGYNQFEAIIWVKPLENFKKLTSFKKID